MSFSATIAAFVLVMAIGSIVGSFVGGQLLGVVPTLDTASPAGVDPRPLGLQGLATQIAGYRQGSQSLRLDTP